MSQIVYSFSRQFDFVSILSTKETTANETGKIPILMKLIWEYFSCNLSQLPSFFKTDMLCSCSWYFIYIFWFLYFLFSIVYKVVWSLIFFKKNLNGIFKVYFLNYLPEYIFWLPAKKSTLTFHSTLHFFSSSPIILLFRLLFLYCLHF